jgi:hypothetical protein
MLSCLLTTLIDWLVVCLTVGVRLFEGVSCIDEAGGRVVFVLELHVDPGGLAERITSSWGDGMTHTSDMKQIHWALQE